MILSHKTSLFLLLGFLILIINSCKEKNTTNPDETLISEKILNQTDKLVATAKVWGFLKYYHPQVAKGKFNWDDQLFSILEKVDKVETSEELSKVFSSWIDKLGEIEACTTCFEFIEKEKFNKNWDLSWIDSEMFSKELREKLFDIKKNRAQDYQHYVTSASAGNIRVQNEPVYETFQWEDKKLRLLSLFRYWNQVEYFFPYKYQMDRDWDKTLEILLPKFLNIQDEQEFHMAMSELIVSVDDSHSHLVTNYTNQYFGYYWAPVKLKMIDGKAVVMGMYDNEKAEKDDWKLGDILIAEDGMPIPEIIAKDRKYLSGSNEPAKFRNIEISLLNGSTTSTEIEFSRDGEIHTKQIKRYLKSEFILDRQAAPKWKFIENNLGYVDLGQLEIEDVKEMMEDLKNTSAIIFDIRNYPKGTLYNIANEINKDNMPFVKFIVPDLNYPGKYTWTESQSVGKKNNEAYQGKIILLINEWTQSHAEFTAMALQTAPDVTVVGSQTSGADGNISDISILGIFRTNISGIGVFYPDGRETQRFGIVPDVEVKTTIEGIKQGKDEILEKAVEIAQGKGG